MAVISKAASGGAGRHHQVAGQGGHLGEQGPQAVDRRAVGQQPGAGLGEGGVRALAGATGSALGRSSVAEQQRRPGTLEVPADVVGEHAQEDVRADPALRPVVDRADREVDRLERAEVPLDRARRL